MRRVGIIMAFAVLAMPGFVQAQSYQCRMPARIFVPKVSAGPVRRMPVTGYTMAVSWSPEFCKSRKGQARHRTQCSGRNGRFGFVLHGLWPESRGSWPQYCPTTRRLTPAEARRNMCMTPSANLLAHQWFKHGACMTKLPEQYFKASRILWKSLKFPAMDHLSREKNLRAGQLRDAFMAANPSWKRRDAIGIKVNRRGWVQELRLCYGKDFMPKACDGKRYGARDGVRMKIWRGL